MTATQIQEKPDTQNRNSHHGDLLIRARGGDSNAWDELVESFSPLVWSIVRGYRLDRATAEDVTQIVWLRLLESCDRIRDPNRLPGWLATTCRREALNAKKNQQRAVATEFESDVEDPAPGLAELILKDEEHAEVLTAFEKLDQEDQLLLTLTLCEPQIPYVEIAEIVGRPVGSLGPTRARALSRLRRHLERR